MGRPILLQSAVMTQVAGQQVGPTYLVDARDIAGLAPGIGV